MSFFTSEDGATAPRRSISASRHARPRSMSGRPVTADPAGSVALSVRARAAASVSLAGAYLVVLLTPGPSGYAARDCVPLGCLMMAACAATYFAAGGPRINAVAAYSYGTAIFVAFPAIYFGRETFARTSPEAVIALLSALFLVQIALLMLPPDASARVVELYDADFGPVLTVGLGSGLLWSIGGLVNRLGLVELPLAFLTIVCLAVSAYMARSRVARVLLLSASAAASLAYMIIGSGEFGRLLRATVVLALPVTVSLVGGRYLAKIALGLATTPAIMVLAGLRLNYLGTVREADVGASEGIGSVLAPLLSGARVLEAYWNGQHTPTGGTSYLASAVVWVPRSLWPDKPIGFGAEIVPVTQPTLVGERGYSDAASYFAEFVWNFGSLGAVLGAVAFIVGLRLLDRRVSVLTDSGPISTAWFLLFVALISGVPNFVWGGSFTWASRMLPVAVPLGLAAVLRTSGRSDRDNSEWQGRRRQPPLPLGSHSTEEL